ncbi:hypothetical protein DUNSADRAFT_17900 [Dunaliella salina]|uniref:Uncharacterized protein n=1 Tax=Dunaliella salina TaxID=3046 RepID=A0ABQ7H8Y6_DUNSA|nr:hypothetical protein DUNSADRAFT_17900 [Dunaliella salina]|eukprot:KAF5843322.1 hypothetical protein DUNSADRAFT_17900 [Dunaliella salina]
MTSLADRFLRERADDVVDVKKAIAKHESAAREERKNDKELLYSKAAKKKGLIKDKGSKGKEDGGGSKGKGKGGDKGGGGGKGKSLGAKGGVGKRKGGKR